MKAKLEVEFSSIKRDYRATHPWPMECVPRIGEQIYGLGLQSTHLEGCEVRSVSYFPDGDWEEDVMMFANPTFTTERTNAECELICDALEMFGWDVQRNVPTWQFNPETGERKLVRGGDESEDDEVGFDKDFDDA